MKKYDAIVFIGRFQPVHNAHIEIIKQASSIAKQVLVVIGSAYQPRTYKNPFSAQERSDMLYRAASKYIAENNSSLCTLFARDYMYNDQTWISQIQSLVHTHTNSNNIAIIGHDKDETSYYLKMFPQWQREQVQLIEPLNSTDIRDLYFRPNKNLNYLSSVVPFNVRDFLTEFSKISEYKQIINEREFIRGYRRQFEHLPYLPVFVTTDAVVVCSGHVLLIKRRSEPGKGLWALPGGFLNANKDKSLEDCMLRELREETGIKVPIPVLRGNVKKTKVFDAIERSARGRTITHAFNIELNEQVLPRIKKADDAEKVVWTPLSALKSECCFEDHYDIVSYFYNLS